MALSDKWIEELKEHMLNYYVCGCDCGDCDAENDPAHVEIYLDELGRGSKVVGEVAYYCSECEGISYRNFYIR